MLRKSYVDLPPDALGASDRTSPSSTSAASTSHMPTGMAPLRIPPAGLLPSAPDAFSVAASPRNSSTLPALLPLCATQPSSCSSSARRAAYPAGSPTTSNLSGSLVTPSNLSGDDAYYDQGACACEGSTQHPASVCRTCGLRL